MGMERSKGSIVFTVWKSENSIFLLGHESDGQTNLVAFDRVYTPDIGENELNECVCLIAT